MRRLNSLPNPYLFVLSRFNLLLEASLSRALVIFYIVALLKLGLLQNTEAEFRARGAKSFNFGGLVWWCVGRCQWEAR